MRANRDKVAQSINSTESYVYETSKDLISKKEELKCGNTVKNTRTINFDGITRENMK